MKRTGLILGVLAVLLVTALWWFFVIISPTNTKIADTQDQLQSAEDNEVLLLTQLCSSQEDPGERTHLPVGDRGTRCGHPADSANAGAHRRADRAGQRLGRRMGEWHLWKPGRSGG